MLLHFDVRTSSTELISKGQVQCFIWHELTKQRLGSSLTKCVSYDILHYQTKRKCIVQDYVARVKKSLVLLHDILLKPLGFVRLLLQSNWVHSLKLYVFPCGISPVRVV